MKKNLLAMTLSLAMMTALMPAVAETDPADQTQTSAPVQVEDQVNTPDPTATPDPTPAPTSVPAPDPTATPEVTSVPATEVPAATEVPFTAKVRIELDNQGQIYFGDRVTLKAIVEQASANYTVSWEYYNVEADVEKGENPWIIIDKETAEAYTFIADESNAALTYRVVLNGTVASDIYNLPRVEARPEEVPEENVTEPAPDAETEPEETEPEVEEDGEEANPEEEADPEEEAEPDETDPEEEAEPDATDPEEDAPEAEPLPERSIKISADWEGELHFGDVCTLVAELSGYEGTDYSLLWQTSADNQNWTDVEGATDAVYELTVTEENYQNYWRVLTIVTDVVE